MPFREKQIYVAPTKPDESVASTVTALAKAFKDARANAKVKADKEASDLKQDLSTINSQTGKSPSAIYGEVQNRLLKFEQAYLQEREDYDKIVADVDDQVVTAKSKSSDNTIELTLKSNDVGTVYLGNDRFVTYRTAGSVQTYKLRNDAKDKLGQIREYVQATNDGTIVSYVRRFVLRGLNLADAWAYASQKQLIPAHPTDPKCVDNEHDPKMNGRHPTPNIDQPLNDAQQIISHTRGWRKRLISTVPSEREIYSTRGAPFDGNTGVATIDLAQVLEAKTAIRDVHCIAYASSVYGYVPDNIIKATAPDTPPNITTPTNYDCQKFRGYRDVIRTREVLVAGDVPYAAVIATPSGKYIVAAAALKSSEANSIENEIKTAAPAGLLAQVTMNYKLYDHYHTYAVLDTNTNAQQLVSWLKSSSNPDAARVQYTLLMPQLAPTGR